MFTAHQIRALREQRKWTQRKFAEELGGHASVVNRYEDPDYGKMTVKTLLDLARVFDVGLIIRFVTFPEFIARTRDVAPDALEADGFDEKQFVVFHPAVSISGMNVTPSHPGARAVIATKTSGGKFLVRKPLSEPVETRAIANG
ncbi:MAG: helix-turn-helix transcriptional regulator [Proteobacteria bacterium]|nr:helix-turn-helix transcriptional regulator [Pseudomonadota bacterium]